MRYTLSGGAVALITVAVTVTLAEGASLPYEASYAIGYCIALATHFSLQRWFVWAHREGFALPIRSQLARYVPFALFNYSFVAASIALLPHLLGVSTSAAYLGAMAIITFVSFLVLRTRIFHAGRVANERV
ncbi:MAG: GtrA family protein [Solirubrobacteraceae bacterium]